MFNIGENSTKYVKIWEVEDKEKYVKVKASTSQKKQDGTYENSNWFINLVGEAKEKGKSLVKGSTIEILSGGISNTYNKEKKETYYNVVVFDFALIGTQPDGSTVSTSPKQTKQTGVTPSPSDGFLKVDDLDDELPF